MDSSALSWLYRYEGFAQAWPSRPGDPQLKQQPGGNLLKYGTGALSRTLLEGLPLTHLELVDSTTFASGIVVHALAPG